MVELSSQPAGSAAPQRLHFLQVLRIVAAMMVVMYHLNGQYQLRSGEHFWLVRYGGMAGVDLFYVISGFIMWRTTEALDGARDAAVFAGRRAWRIYSGYIPIALGMLTFSYFTNPARFNLYNIPAGLALLPTPPSQRIIPVTWTLTHELMFYAAMTAGVLLRGHRTAALALFFGAIAGGALVQTYSTTGAYWAPSLFSPIVLEFALGIGAAVLSTRITLSRPTLVAAAGAVLFLAVVVVSRAANHIPGTIESMWTRLASFGAASAVIVLGVSQMDRVLRAPKALVRLGDASYALYLLHLPLLAAMLYWMRQSPAMDGFAEARPGLWVVLLVAGFLVASLAYFYAVERPLLRLARWRRPAGKSEPSP